MAQCASCHTETELYDGGTPICVGCSEAREARRKPAASQAGTYNTLYQDVVTTTARATAASEIFRAVLGDIPSKLPHPDGTQRVHNASRELSEARGEMMKAHTRLDDFLSKGIIPEDLKREG